MLAGLEIPPREEGDADLSKPQANYLQGFLTVNGFRRLDEGVLAALSQEQASELMDQVGTISEGGYDEIVASGGLKVADTGEAANGRSKVLMWVIVGVVIFAVILMALAK